MTMPGGSMPGHVVVDAGRHGVPRPFRAFAVRSDEPCHAFEARAPYAWIHVIAGGWPGPGPQAHWVAEGESRVCLREFSDIDYAETSWARLAALAGEAVAADALAGALAAALQATGVLGESLEPYLAAVRARVDFLATQGAGFHNDVAGRWSRSLFWLWALDADDVEFVMPHAGVRLPVCRGDLLLFDPAMAHGLCRPADGGQAVGGSFDGGAGSRQLFLTGELALTDAQWRAAGAPWLPVEHHEALGALDLMAAEFDERSGAIKQLRGLARCMARTTCHVEPVPSGPDTNPR